MDFSKQLNPKEVHQYLLQEVNRNPDRYQLTYQVCINIKKLPLDHSEFILGLMNEHFFINSKKKQLTIIDLASSASKKNNTMNVVYKGKTYDTGKGPGFDGNNLPVLLQKIITAYMTMISE